MLDVGDLVEDAVLGTYGIVLRVSSFNNGVPFYRVRWFDSYCAEEDIVASLLILKSKKNLT